ncbi:hypothetical protein [Nocardioides pelophilus]|uniref:hypothetical protein n=1 Tax=Nocardioides pelophilus TaxID=2172019 RepID=UPI0016017603|nr:hypothetical protein [Nocardioides pelophilus]
MPTFDWVDLKSRHLVLRRAGDASEADFDASPIWQDYLWETYGRRPPTLLILKVRDDADDYAFKGGRQKNGKLVAAATIPSAWLDGATAEDNAEVYRRAKERFFHDMATAADLPAPPPLPPRLPPRAQKVAPGAGIAWLSERKGFKAPDTAENEWFFADPAWQDYLPQTQGDLFSIVDLVVDRDSVRRTVGRKANGEVSVSVYIPSELFVDNADPELTLVEIARDTFVWGMEKFGWPAPPPIPARPPGHEPRSRPINAHLRSR